MFPFLYANFYYVSLAYRRTQVDSLNFLAHLLAIPFVSAMTAILLVDSLFGYSCFLVIWFVWGVIVSHRKKK